MYSGPGSDKGRPCRLSPGPIYMPGGQDGRGPKFSFGSGPAAGSCGSTPNRGSAQEPGPGEYELSAAVGPQFSSLARSSPQYSWGSTVRNTGGAKVSRGESGSPYELRASVGPQADSKKQNKPAYAFGTSQRFGVDRNDLRRSAAAPGPGSYAMPKAVEAQQESTKKSMPAYGFGTSTRVQANMVYWKGKAGTAEGKDTPGPSYKLKSSVGGQIQSDRRSGSSFGFGSSSRFGPGVSAKDRTPGPGEYNA